jgi:hypothetical protein
LPADSLCLADRNFFSYSLWQAALASGATLLWRARADLILPKLKRLSDGSYLTKIYPSPRARAREVDGIPARLITYRLGKGREEYRLLCSILDPRRAPAIQLANLYTKRWTIETVLAELKTRLRGARVVLRSRTPDLTRQDFWGLLLAHFGVRALMHEAALEQKIEATDLSFVHAVRTIARYLPLSFLFFPQQNKKLFRSLLHELAEERLRRRLHRHSPRAVKRKMSNYLTTTRAARTRLSTTQRMDAALS